MLFVIEPRNKMHKKKIALSYINEMVKIALDIQYETLAQSPVVTWSSSW